VLLEGVPPLFNAQSKSSPVSCDHAPSVFSKPSLYGKLATVELHDADGGGEEHPLINEAV